MITLVCTLTACAKEAADTTDTVAETESVVVSQEETVETASEAAETTAAAETTTVTEETTAETTVSTTVSEVSETEAVDESGEAFEIDFSAAADLPIIHHEALAGVYEAFDEYDIDNITENTLYYVTSLADGSAVYGVFEDGAIDHTDYPTYIDWENDKQTVYIQRPDGTVSSYVQNWFVNWSASAGIRYYEPSDIALCDIDGDGDDELVFTSCATGSFAQCYGTLVMQELSGDACAYFGYELQDSLISENIAVTVERDDCKLLITACGEDLEYKIDLSLAQDTDDPQPDSGHIYFEAEENGIFAYLGIRCGRMPDVPCYIRLRVTYDGSDFAFSEPSVMPFSESRFA
ncbi:MAG: hypothetical protein ACI4J6_00490 [Oscillospiraceae bacterium]